MRTHILKCTWSWIWHSKEERYFKTTEPKSTWLNVNEIKTIDPIIDPYDNLVMGSSIFYALACNNVKDDRKPDELMQLINNL